MVSSVRIAVIGVGPRGLSVLERVVSHAQLAGPPIELLLVEPGELGVGIHQLKQPDYLLLNTIAAQLTIFSDEQMTAGAPVTIGPSFHDWCRARRSSVRFDDFLPRWQLGEYLQWAAGEFLARAPDRLTVRHLATYASDVRQNPNGATVTLADGTEHQFDLAIVTTGHGLAAAGQVNPDDMITTPYPLPDRVVEISAGANVALVGTGLSAMDVIAALTVGRGGEFDGGTYRLSGREPRIVLANRAGRLPCARPSAKAGRTPAPARHLTVAAITALRESTEDGLLDFRRDVEPLVHREALGRMAAATQAEIDTVERVLRPADESFRSYDEYHAALLERATADLHEADRGLGESLVKEGLEVLRDHREGLRAAIDPPGLTEQSHRYFMTEYTSLVNRAVIGPQKERIHELLALIAAGVVVPGPGPAPELVRAASGWVLRSTKLAQAREIPVDVVVQANLRWPTTGSRLDPVADSLREWVAPGPGGEPGLRLDRDGFAMPRATDGTRPSVAVFGPPAEGASYYNHYVPSPGVWSRALTDLDRVLGPVLTADAALGKGIVAIGPGGDRPTVAVPAVPTDHCLSSVNEMEKTQC